MITVPVRYPHVVRDTDRHGNVRVYLRLPGQVKIRLRELPGTAAFDAEYRRAIAVGAPVKAPAKGEVRPGSINALCVAYFASAEFKRMTPRSQRVRRLILDKFRADYGNRSAAQLQPSHLRRIMDAKVDTPEAANGLLKALRAVFAAAIVRDLLSDNPALRVPYLPPKRPDGFHAWTVEEVAKFEARWPIGSVPRLALALLLFTGQRRSDVVQLGKQHERNGWLHFTQTKNRTRKPVRLELPIVAELRRIIDATPSGDLAYLTSERGTPYSAETFGNAFRKWCRQAGLPQCSPHGLRKAAASRLAESGASAMEIAAVTGHRTLKEVARYTQAAQQRVMAEAALTRLSGPLPEQEKSHQSAATLGWDENARQPIETKGPVKWMVPRGGIEPPTLRFSVACSTN